MGIKVTSRKEWIKKNKKIDYDIALELYNQGLTDKKVAESFDINPRTIGRWRAKNGLVANFKPRLTEDELLCSHDNYKAYQLKKCKVYMGRPKNKAKRRISQKLHYKRPVIKLGRKRYRDKPETKVKTSIRNKEYRSSDYYKENYGKEYWKEYNSKDIRKKYCKEFQERKYKNSECIDCKKTIWGKSNRCKSCAQKEIQKLKQHSPKA